MVRSRIWCTPEQKTDLRARWKQGHSISAISRTLERRNKTGVQHKTGVQRIVALHCGIAPPPQQRAAAALKREEREEISRGIAAGRSVRNMTGVPGRSASTTCREVERYRGLLAKRGTWSDKLV